MSTTIASGFYFGESPRWHDGELWFSDIHGQRVHRMTLGGETREVLHLHDDLPSGLGWLPDGRLLVVAMDTQQLRRLEPDGTAYVGDTGWRLWAPDLAFAPGRLLVVAADGVVVQVVEGLMAPNGITLADGRLVVAEPGAARLTAFRLAADGTLVDQHSYAALGRDRRTLVVCVAPDWHREAALRAPRAHLEAFPVPVAGTGTP